jgi:enoyl-CoA hydratase/carnithine racemase
MPVRVAHEDGVAVVTLDRPERLNAINTALRAALIETLARLDADPAVGAIVITGAGERAFSAGQDLTESAALEPATVIAWLDHQRQMFQAVRALSKGCVVAYNGIAAGAGFQIGLCADMRIGHPGIRIGQPEVRAGLASIVGSYLMSLHVGLGINQQLSLTGELIDGTRAYAVGLLNHLVPADQVFAKAIAEARGLAALPQTALRLTKARFRQVTQPGFDDACSAIIRYQLEAYLGGAPQAIQRDFLARRGGA